MPKVRLTNDFVIKAKCPKNLNKTFYIDAETKGLQLEVRKSGAKTFYYSYTNYLGNSAYVKIADASSVNLDTARKKAIMYANEITLGHNPILEKQKAKEALKNEQVNQMTFERFISDKYIPYIKTYKRSWTTDESMLRNHLLLKFGKQAMNSITTEEIASFILAKSKTLSPGFCNRILVLFRYCFSLAIKKYKIPEISSNPAKEVSLLADPFGKRELFLTKQETARLIEQIKLSQNQTLAYIVPFLILTGARKREALDAKWQDFDIDRRIWTIPICKIGKPRYVPIGDNVIKLLESIPKIEDCEYIFANPKTKKPYVSVFNAWDMARNRANLPKLRLHDLRHSFASFLINNGRSIYEVQKILGHTQIKTTQRYAHLSQETLMDAVNSMSSIISFDNAVGI